MESGYQTFAQNFSDCCAQSCTRLAYERQQTDPEYAAASRECDELYAAILERLGKDAALINRFDAAKNRTHSFSNELIYQQGFEDCVCLLRWIGLF